MTLLQRQGTLTLLLRRLILTLLGALPPFQREFLSTLTFLYTAYLGSPLIGEYHTGRGPLWYLWRVLGVPPGAAAEPGKRAPDAPVVEASWGKQAPVHPSATAVEGSTVFERGGKGMPVEGGEGVEGGPRTLHTVMQGAAHVVLVFCGYTSGPWWFQAQWNWFVGAREALESGMPFPVEVVWVATGDCLRDPMVADLLQSNTGRLKAVCVDDGGVVGEMYGARSFPMYVVRPDKHVGFRSSDCSALGRYFGLLGLKAP